MKSLNRQAILHYALSAALLAASVAITLMLGALTRHAVTPDNILVSLEGDWKIMIGDDEKFADEEYDDSSWDTVKLPGSMLRYAIKKADSLVGILWLRKTVHIDRNISRKDLSVILGRIGNADETFLNGNRIGGMGSFPPDEISMWYHPRYYKAPQSMIRFGGNNVIAIRISYQLICEVMGALAITDLESGERSGKRSDFILITMTYVIIAMGVPIFIIFFFFYIRRRTSLEYLFYCLQLMCGLVILLEYCNYWNVYGTMLMRIKILLFSWVLINVCHPLFLHRIYDLKRRKMEIVLWIYLAIIVVVLLTANDSPFVLLQLSIFTPLTILIGAYNISCHLSALIKRRPYSKIFSFFGMMVICGAIQDGMVYLSKILGYTVQVFGYSFEYMVFGYTAAMLYTGTTLVMVSRLITMTDEIQDMNINLEIKVQDRTRELEEAHDALWCEMDIAKRIQTDLLPKKPAIPGYEIAACMQPATEVGGDYYDIISAGGRDWLVIGDVSGHGLPAGLVMMMAQTAIHTAVRQNPDLVPSHLLTVINGAITENIRQLREDKYITMTVFASHRNGQFHFSGLHQDIMVYRAASDSVDLIETRGFWIGLDEDISSMVSDDCLVLDVGDIMLVYTDGITEAWRIGSVKGTRDPDADMFGADNLMNVFHKLGAQNPCDIKNGILDAMAGYQKNDDVTMVVIKRVA